MSESASGSGEAQEAGLDVVLDARPIVAEPGDLVLLLSSDHKRYLTRLQPGQSMHTHLGAFRHDTLIGQPWGSAVLSHLGHRALLLQPSLTDLMKQLKRGTQIIYPKDAAYIVYRLSLRAGSTVVEAGTGSGGLTTALAWAVAPTGIVYTHEARPDILRVARNNLERVGLLPYVKLSQTDIKDGFRAANVDAAFLDVREPWLYLSQVRAALKPGGYFASILPTANQVIDLLRSLEEHHFADIAVEELLLRAYKPTPDRFRPDDRVVGHTGFLIFARCIALDEDMARWQGRERQRYAARKQAQDAIEDIQRRRDEEIARGENPDSTLPLP